MKHLAIYPILVALCHLCLISCSKQESVTPLDPMIEKVNHCGCDDALQQLEWLRNTVIFMETHRGDIHAEICTCKYDEGKDGFLTNYCVSCPDGFVNLHDCQGNVLVSMGGIAGDGYDVHDIDPTSIHCIYRNYHIPKITYHRWYLARFVDRATNTSEAPMWNGRLQYYVIEFNPDGTMSGSGVNSLHGTYHLDHGNISIHIQPVTEIYDATGWEDRMIDALNAAIKCNISEDHIWIFYNYTNTYMEFRALDESMED